MKIAILSPYAHPEYGACSRRSRSFSDYFQSQGHEVRILAPSRRNLKSNEYTTRYRNIKELVKLLYHENFDVIIGTSPPITHPFFGMAIAKLTRTPFILDIRDPYTFAIKGLGIKHTHNLKYWISRAMEYSSHLFANRITAVTQFDVDLIKKTYNRSAHLAMNGTEFVFKKPTKTYIEKARKKFGLPKNRPILVFSGGSGAKEFDKMSKTISPLLQKHNAFLAITVASDNSAESKKDIQTLKETFREYGVERHVKIMVNITDQELIDLLLCSDIGIDPIADGMLFCIPVKTFDYAACYLPVAAKGPQGGELQNIVEANDLGFFAPNWDLFSNKLEKALRNIKEFKKQGERGAKTVQERFTRQNTNEKMLRLIETLR